MPKSDWTWDGDLEHEICEIWGTPIKKVEMKYNYWASEAFLFFRVILQLSFCWVLAWTCKRMGWFERLTLNECALNTVVGVALLECKEIKDRLKEIGRT